jgi:predicted  nucleic acid-binding Zn-ribbon protein
MHVNGTCFVEEVIAVRVDLQAMLILQEKDSAIAAIEKKLNALRPEIEALDADLADVEEELEAARKAATKADKRRADLEVRIESYRVMQERRRQRLEWVRGAKEASAIMAELDMARGVLAKEEAEWMRSADDLQEADEYVAEVEARVRALEEEQKPKREELASQNAAYQIELVAARSVREAAAKDIDAKILQYYNRIHGGRAPHVLYPLTAGACGHCHTSVPLHRRQQIVSGPVVEPCEACGVLVYNDVSE